MTNNINKKTKPHEILIKNVIILDVANQKQFPSDLLIIDGFITQIKKSITLKTAKLIDGKGAYLSPAFIDLGIHLDNLSDNALTAISHSATKSGVSTILINPHNNLPINTPDQLNSIYKFQQKNSSTSPKIIALANLYQNNNGLQLNEIGNLLNSNALSLCANPMPENLRLFIQYIRYAQSFSKDLPIWVKPVNPSFEGLIHEGKYSSKYGLLPIPSLAENAVIAQLIEIIEYFTQAGSNLRFHLNSISTARAANLVSQNHNLSATIPITNLLATEEMLNGFNSNYLTDPPVRTEADKSALRKYLLANLDQKLPQFIISSNHYYFDHQKLKAPFGEVPITGGILANIENLLTGVCKIAKEENTPLIKLLSTITTKPAQLINKPSLAQIQLNMPANICIFSVANQNPHVKEMFINHLENS